MCEKCEKAKELAIESALSKHTPRELTEHIYMVEGANIILGIALNKAKKDVLFFKITSVISLIISWVAVYFINNN